MKTCPHCHIQVGGSAQYCPLCQNPLVGTPEPDRYPKVVPPARQASLFYRIAAFVLRGQRGRRHPGYAAKRRAGDAVRCRRG